MKCTQLQYCVPISVFKCESEFEPEEEEIGLEQKVIMCLKVILEKMHTKIET